MPHQIPLLCSLILILTIPQSLMWSLMWRCQWSLLFVLKSIHEVFWLRAQFNLFLRLHPFNCHMTYGNSASGNDTIYMIWKTRWNYEACCRHEALKCKEWWNMKNPTDGWCEERIDIDTISKPALILLLIKN